MHVRLLTNDDFIELNIILKKTFNKNEGLFIGLYMITEKLINEIVSHFNLNTRGIHGLFHWL